ncbi:MAG: response regulator transcription factor [Ferruginibacter sp.]
MSHTIVIIDDHLLIAKAITSIIEQFNNYEVLYECENGKAMTEKFKHKKNIPDIVLLDISMPVMDGFETALWLRENNPEVLVMALTMQGDDESLIRMIKCGAKGYLHKNVHPVELAKALDMLVQKGFYYPDWATSRVLHNIAAGNDEKHTGFSLSEREKEFLKYACTELTYKEIGEKMFCSSRTVESYRDALFEKLGARTRVALALYAVRIGLYKL